MRKRRIQHVECRQDLVRLLRKWLLRLLAPTIEHRASFTGLLAQAILARLDALESDNAVPEPVQLDDDDEASLDDEDQVYQKKQSKGTKRKTRQAKALENKKAPKTFIELLHEANLESLPPHVPTYLRAAAGPPSSTCRRHFCTVCGFSAPYTCVQCGMRFCSIRCRTIHNDTRCLKFVA